ncbi:hypothetical protein ACCT06_09775 [Rhizobium ruizarguesonis]
MSKKKRKKFEVEQGKITTKKRKYKRLGARNPELTEPKPPTRAKGKLKKRRILPDLTADLSKYEDTREPVIPGKTIRNEFKKYPWRNSSFATVKG